MPSGASSDWMFASSWIFILKPQTSEWKIGWIWTRIWLDLLWIIGLYFISFIAWWSFSHLYIIIWAKKKINYRYKSPAISERFFFLGYYFFPSFFTIFLFYYLSMHPSSSQVQRGRPVVVGTDARKLIHPSPSTPAPLHPSIHLSIHSFIRFSSCAPFSHVENSGKRDGDGKRKKNKNLFNYRSFIL